MLRIEHERFFQVTSTCVILDRHLSNMGTQNFQQWKVHKICSLVNQSFALEIFLKMNLNLFSLVLVSLI